MILKHFFIIIKKIKKSILFCLQQRLTIVFENERVFYKRCQQVFNNVRILSYINENQ